jgi:hypothetical protein
MITGAGLPLMPDLAGSVVGCSNGGDRLDVPDTGLYLGHCVELPGAG